MRDALAELLQPRRLTEVVDVGANPIDDDPPYKAMLAAGLCRVTGFEPQPDALQKLLQAKGALETYLPHALGDGGRHTLHICAEPGMTSLLEPDPRNLALFDLLRPMAAVMQRVPVQTRRLDDVAEVAAVDFLKIDVQGSELAVFRGGETRLRNAVAIQVEVSFVTLYRGQPPLGAVDLELRRMGFIPHCLPSVKCLPISPCLIDGNPRKAMNQLVEADLVYVRDIARPEAMDNEQLKHLALVAHHCYRSFDLALRCVMLLSARGEMGTQAMGTDAQNAYLGIVRGPAQA